MKSRHILIVVALVLTAAGAGVGDITIETVPVGNPGNAPDDTGYGAVGYLYNIGKYEVTNAQYSEFLNAVAATDTYGLYHENMGASDIGGISRSGSPGSYTYAPKGNDPNWLNRPVNYVSFWDACRFANWVHNGQPISSQNLNTTEDGAYLLNGLTNPPNESITRKPDARIWIPSEDEWYKAAYYKGGGTNAGYWDYPTQTNTGPTSETPPGMDMLSGSANYYDDARAVGAPYYTTEVGAYSGKPSDSAYGTYDQGGNVFEWNEGIISASSRGLRGGSFNDLQVTLQAANRDDYDAVAASPEFGFRVAVPEPASMALLALGALAVLRRRK